MKQNTYNFHTYIPAVEDFLVPGGLLDNAINNRQEPNNVENDYIRNDRGPLPDAEVNDLIPDPVTDDLRKRIFLEGRQQPVKSEEDLVSRSSSGTIHILRHL